MKPEEKEPIYGRSVRFAEKYGNQKLIDIHQWLRKKFGSASFCSHCPGRQSVKSNIYEWCLRHDCEYDYNKDNFIQLCRSCHRKYDQVPGNGKIPVVQYDVNLLLINRFDSVTNAAKETKILRTAITNSLNGRAPTAGGFIWKYAAPSTAVRKSVNTKLITHNGITKSMTDWSLSLGGHQTIVYYRINILGWAIDKAISTPIRKKSKYKRLKIITPPSTTLS